MDPTALFADEAFARRIALGLLRDREAAEDLVQDVWLEIIEKPPRHASSPRGYVATLLRRLWLRKRRSDTRRGARERDSAPDHARHGTSELVARAEIHQRTVAATLALEEPYRSTVLLRFFEDLGPEEIAEREGVPVETVRTRLKRALGMLRARLEQEGRDWREEWALALGLDPAARTLPRAPGRSSLVRSAGVAAVAVAIGVVWLVRSESGPEPRAVLPAPEVAARPAPIDPVEPARAAAEEQSGLVGEVPDTPAAPVRMLRGRVVDEAGGPLSGVHAQLAIERFIRIPELDNAVSDAQGAFALSIEAWCALPETARALLRLQVTLWKDGRQPHGQFVELDAERMPREVEVVLRPGRVAFARVVDPTGAPAGGIRTMITVRGDARRKPRHDTGAITDGEGSVAVGLGPGECVTEVLLWNEELGFAYRGEHELPARTVGDVDLGTIALQEGALLRGRCLYPDGSPVNAVSLTTLLVEPAPDGGFRPAGEGPSSEFALGVAKLPVQADHQGRFEVRGLRDGIYKVATEFAVSVRAWRVPGPDMEVVFNGHRLIVEVIGPEGRPLAEAPIALTVLDAAREPEGESYHAITGDDRIPCAMNVDAGDTVAVLALAPGCASVEQIVSIPERPYETSLRLELAREERKATLVLRPSRASDAWRIDLCAPISGAPLPGFQDLVAGADGRVHGLPIGSYRVRIEPLPPAEADALARDFAAPAIAPVTLEAGETVLDFAVVPAARLRVVFGAAADPGTRTPIDVERLEGVGTDKWDWLASAMRLARSSLELWAIAADGERPLRRVFGLAPRDGQYVDLTVPSGALRLRLALDGRAPIDRELSPGPGETLEVPIPLDENAPVR